MDNTGRKIRRALLSPLSRRPQRVFDQKKYANALRRLDDRAIGEGALEELRKSLIVARKKERSKSWKDPDRAQEFVALARALYASRRISRQEYVFYAVAPVEGVHDGRWLHGHYDKELAPIQQSLRKIKAEHGLDEDQDWLRGQGPEEHTKLNKEYEKALETKFLEALREFGLNDVAGLFERSRSDFDRLRERGRRSVFHRDEYVLAVRDVVHEHEKDASGGSSGSLFGSRDIAWRGS